MKWALLAAILAVLFISGCTAPEDAVTEPVNCPAYGGQPVEACNSLEECHCCVTTPDMKTCEICIPAETGCPSGSPYM